MSANSPSLDTERLSRKEPADRYSEHGKQPQTAVKSQQELITVKVEECTTETTKLSPEITTPTRSKSKKEEPNKEAVTSPNSNYESIPWSPSRFMESYHVVSLNHVLREALQTHAHLLEESETAVGESLTSSLSNPAVYLFARLYRRKHDQWHPIRTLVSDYTAQMPADVNDAVAELVEHRLLLSTKASAVHDTAIRLLPTIPLDRLRKLWRMVPSARKLSSKGDIVAAIDELLLADTKTSTETSSDAPRKKRPRSFRQGTLTSVSPADRVARAIVKDAGAAVRLCEHAVSALQRMHFLVLLDDEAHLSSNFILSFTRQLKLAEYECIRANAVFPSKTALAAFETARDLERKLEEALEKDANGTRNWLLAASIGALADGFVREFLELPTATSTAKVLVEVEHERVVQDESELKSQLAHPFFRRYTAHWVYVRIIWHAVQAWEALDEYEVAVERLELLLATRLLPKRRGKILERLSIDLLHNLKRPRDALEHIVGALENGEALLHIGDRHRLAHRAMKMHLAMHLAVAQKSLPANIKPKARRLELARKSVMDTLPEVVRDTLDSLDNDIPKTQFYRVPIAIEQTRKRARYWENASAAGAVGRRGRVTYQSLEGDGVTVYVEELALEFYRARGGWDGRHDEGGALRFLFVLLLWECAVFADVPDVFQSQFQDRPLDLYTEAFYLSRQDAIDTRLKQVAHMDEAQLEEEVRALYSRYEGTSAVGCHWKSYESDEIACLAAGLGGPSIARISSLLAQDYNYWSSGIADLILWRRDDGGKAYTKMVEVKSQRDRISSGQRAWFSELIALGVDCEEFRVVEKESADSVKPDDLRQGAEEGIVEERTSERMTIDTVDLTLNDD